MPSPFNALSMYGLLRIMYTKLMALYICAPIAFPGGWRCAREWRENHWTLGKVRRQQQHTSDNIRVQNAERRTQNAEGSKVTRSKRGYIYASAGRAKGCLCMLYSTCRIYRTHHTLPTYLVSSYRMIKWYMIESYRMSLKYGYAVASGHEWSLFSLDPTAQHGRNLDSTLA